MGRSMNNKNPIFCSIAIIEERIQEKLTVDNLANSVHFSKYHYQRMFREAVGDSVMRYVTKRRLFLAAEELAKTKASILEIALKYGFDSHEGFSRSFRAYMGVTPTEYRKYHLSITFPQTQKERCAMLYSKTTDEMIKELNGLIVQTKETAAYTRKYVETVPQATEWYRQFGDSIAARADAMADELTEMLNRITPIAQHPDEISARFVILKAIEDIAFGSYVTAFQTRLTVMRAKPEHRAAFEPMCDKYDTLSQNARIKTDRIARFFQELSSLIFQDMREHAKEKLQEAVEKGRAAASSLLADPTYPYAYIAEGLMAIVDELSSMTLEEVTVSALEDYFFRLDMIKFAADMDALRMPSHKALFDGISDFREAISEAAAFFQSLSEEIIQAPAAPAKIPAGELAFQENVLLFYLKGEIQKLGPHLNESQKAAFDSICKKLQTAINQTLTCDEADEAAVEEITKILNDIYTEMTTEAEKLGMYGTPIQFIADEIRRVAVM